MRKLVIYLSSYKKESFLAPFFKLLEVVFDLIVPLVVARIIDVGIVNNDRIYILQQFLILLLMAAIGLACSFTAQFYAARASVGFAYKSKTGSVRPYSDAFLYRAGYTWYRPR